jgi:hypothetical protein
MLTGMALTGGWVLGAQTNSYIFSTHLGGSHRDVGRAIATDSNGNSYVAGETHSLDFPIYPRFGAPSPGYLQDAFLTRYNASGRVLSSIYLGPGNFSGTTFLEISGVAVSPDGSAYVVGSQRDLYESEYAHGFLEKVSGSTIEYHYSLGDTYARGSAVAVDSAGNAYVTGHGFYYRNGIPTLEVYVEKFDSHGSSAWRVSLFGSGGSESRAIAVDPVGNVYVAGNTSSSDFPTVNAADNALGFFQDAFVTKLGPSGAIVFSTFLGGSGIDTGQSLALAPDGSVWVGGVTRSADFPTRNASQSSLRGPQDIFLTRFSSAGAILSSTYLGGSGTDDLQGLALDLAGSLYLASTTGSADSPLRDPSQPGCTDRFVSRLSPSFQLLGSTCVPGADVLALAVDAAQQIHLTGSTAGGLPVVNAAQPAPAGGGDAFATVLQLNRPPDCSAAFASPASIWPPNGRLVPIFVRGVTDPEGGFVSIVVTGVRQDEPLSRAGTPDATGTGTEGVSIRADRAGGGDGRVYRLSFTATDPQGASCTGMVTVCVPHDQGQGRTCGDGGGLFSSGG